MSEDIGYFVSFRDFKIINGIIPESAYSRARCGRDPNECAQEGSIESEERKGFTCYLCKLRNGAPVFNNITQKTGNYSIRPEGRLVYCGLEGDLNEESKNLLNNSVSVKEDK